MQLNEHDLEQLDDEAMDAMDTERLRVLTLKLLVDLKEAHELLGQDLSNRASAAARHRGRKE